MSMTRKDYRVIAKVLAEHNNGSSHMHGLIRAMADELKIANPRFNQDRFVMACNWYGNLTGKTDYV